MNDVTNMERIADALERLATVAEAKLVYTEIDIKTFLEEFSIRNRRVHDSHISFNNLYLATSRATAEDVAKAELEIVEADKHVQIYNVAHPLLKKIAAKCPR